MVATNLNEANETLTSQVAEYTNHMDTKDMDIFTFKKKTSQIQDKIKN